MKTEQEQIEEMSCILTMLINCGGGCMAQYCHLVDNYAKNLLRRATVMCPNIKPRLSG